MTPLRRAVAQYLALRRALGFLLPRYDGVLNDLVSFLERDRANHITTKGVMRWVSERTDISTLWRAGMVCIVRGFARYWSVRDPGTEVPPVDLFPRHRQRRTPYLYTEAQIRRLVDRARRIPSRDPLWPLTLSTLIGLLAVAGLRIGEALSLTPSDVDFVQSVLVIRSTKFRKSRLVPLRPSTGRALAEYARQRERQWPNSPWFFASTTGRALQHGSVYGAFQRLLDEERIPRSKARLHDFRHRLAVYTLIRWYRAGDDTERRLPILSAYLGHCSVRETYWYLSAFPELMEKACARFERHWEKVS